jgi:hypothetical protein
MKSDPQSAQEPQPYLLFLAQPSVAVRREAASRLRDLGLRVVAQYGPVAIEVIATPDQAQAAQDLGIFSVTLGRSMQEQHLQRLTDEQGQVAQQWNTRFTSGYRDLVKDRSHLGKSWADPGFDPPAPHSAIGPEEFLSFIEDYEYRTGNKPWQDAEDSPGGEPEDQHEQPEEPRGPMAPEQFVRYERELAERLGDPTAAYHLARLAWRLGPSYYSSLFDINRDFLEALLAHFFHVEATCWEMHGEIAVGIVVVESSASDGPKFGASERNEICQEIIDGLNWLARQHPSGNLSWVYDFQFTSIDAANGNNGDCAPGNVSALEAGWRNPAMAQVNFNGTTYASDWASVAKYREDMRNANQSAHAISIFVTPYNNCWHAYAGAGHVVLAKHNNWGHWGRSSLDRITAHEVSHLFGAADEYTGAGTPCSTCSSVHGCDQTPNGNCGACARPQQDCYMGGNHRRICAYSRGQIGWSTIFVELTTGDVAWAGTDDDVWLDIGDRTFVLDTADHDDRERNNREGYALWAPEVSRQDIKRIMIRKSEDGSAGGWRLGGVKVWYQGTVICDQPSINRWLEDDELTWTGCIFNRDLTNTLEVRISTADVSWAGTDDDVSITLAGRVWNLDNAWHDDFERGHTDIFHLDPGTGLYVSAIHSVRIHKSSDGIAGGWKLKGVRVMANGATLYNNQGINTWLEDNHRTWTGSL